MVSKYIRDRFDAHKHQIEHEAQKAEELDAEAKAINTKIREKKLRIEKGLPSPESCPDCWVERGDDRRMEAATAGDSVNYDRFRCRSCGFFYDVKIAV